MKTVIRYTLMLAGILLIRCSSNNTVQFEVVDALQKVFPESNYFAPFDAHIDVARGEHASLQFVVRANSDIQNLKIKIDSPESGDSELADIKTGFVGFVKVGRANPEPSKDSYKPMSGYFPDPITYEDSRDVPFGTTQPIWVSVKIPKDCPTGLYTGTAEITCQVAGETISKTKSFEIEVFKPVIESTSLWVTNWFFLDRLHYLNNNQPVEKHGDLYWELSRVMAKTLADYRQNVAMISLFDHTDFSFENDKWDFDFSNFNKMVDLFAEEGVIGRLEGGHLGSRIDGGWSSPFGLYVPVFENDSIDKELLPLNSQKAKDFYAAFLPAFVENIKANGWDGQYIQHIADEPIEDNVESYIEISKFLKTLVPDLKVIEACHTHQLENMVDIWVPQMNFLKSGMDFYNERQAKGDEAWYYTCLSPKGEWANRFVEQPLIKTRLLHWVNFKYNIPGYLHWGFNFWGSNSGIVTAENPFDDVSGMIVSSGNILPGGDCWISYPGYKTIYPSIRLEAMRDGIVDYELLKMLRDKFPKKADELVGTTVYGFEHYDINIGEFRKKRREILMKLSE
ncbi:glycoside hydrolase domain-containing protein [Sunxiuqinia sp. sy24]|uniref:glycoside hydrolase domain-containing protein n=1 Tax=Sunxiuqinia sp. sy24 TaxID=3461495 RepID=UPI0040456CCC